MKFGKVLFFLFLILVLSLVSCSTGIIISEKNRDGSPIWTTEIPKSSKLLYGVGKAKLSNEKNSKDASYSIAVTDLAKQLSIRVEEATALYSNDINKSTQEAYENIKVTSVSFTLKGVVTEDRWTAKDGTVWTLVSIKVKNLPQMYEEASKAYMKEQEEEILDIREKLEKLIEQLGELKDEDSLIIKAAAEKKASTLEAEISETLSSVKCDSVRDAIEKSLIIDGYILED